MSLGMPTFSTQMGVRGLNLSKNIHYIEVDANNFADVLNDKLDCLEEMKSISEEGKEYININYSWKGIAEYVANNIEEATNTEKGNSRIGLCVK